MTRIAIVGASGYAGGELARLALAHPNLEVGTLVAGRNEGRQVRDVHPHLRELATTRFSGADLAELGSHDVVALALPHGQSGELGQQLEQNFPETLLIDLGADRRLKDRAAWERFYGGEHSEPWAYGLPELVHADGTRQRERLVGQRRIAAPGCNATAVSLGLAPLVADGVVVTDDIVSTLAVAPSGAGRSLRDDLLASERIGSAVAYAAGGTHRHIPEIIQNLVQAGGVQPGLSMTPILTPLSRGILAVTTATLSLGASTESAYESISSAYAGEAFIDVLPEGTQPSTGSVLGSNSVAMGLVTDPHTQKVTVTVAIDNLYKGTAGAAIQSLNVALGWEETLGLSHNGVAP